MNKSEIAEKAAREISKTLRSRVNTRWPVSHQQGWYEAANDVDTFVAAIVERAIAESQQVTVQKNPPFVLSDDCESNSVTYRAPEVITDEPEPEKCPTCNGYHLGGCHRAELGDGEPSPSPLQGHWFVTQRVVKKAVQWNGSNVDEIAEFTGEQAMVKMEGERDALVIQTLEGLMVADIGDWIIRGVNGEFYPCKPDIFAKTYEPFESGAAQEVSPSANFVSEIRPRPDDPSCHVCGAQMVVKEWKCLSCGTTTGCSVEEVSPLSPEPREIDGHPVGWCCKHCYDGGYQAAMRLMAEGDTRELKAALKLGLKLIKSANRKRDQPWWDDALAFTVETERLLG